MEEALTQHIIIPTTPNMHQVIRPFCLFIALLVFTIATLDVNGFHLPIIITSPSPPSTSITTQLYNESPKTSGKDEQRRSIIRQSSSTIAHAVISALLLPFVPSPQIALAIDDDNDSSTTTTAQPKSEPYTRTSSSSDKYQFSYTITPPPTFIPGNKPLKTHLDEINFAPEPSIRGYTLGITVDPVRISSITQFGTPEEVAARVVTAEVKRDGVFKVTLAKDPIEDKQAGCYDIEFISDGKRGTKRSVTRIYVKDGYLYVLTAQSKEDEYDAGRERDIYDAVRTFKPL